MSEFLAARSSTSVFAVPSVAAASATRFPCLLLPASSFQQAPDFRAAASRAAAVAGAQLPVRAVPVAAAHFAARPRRRRPSRAVWARSLPLVALSHRAQPTWPHRFLASARRAAGLSGPPAPLARSPVVCLPPLISVEPILQARCCIGVPRAGVGELQHWPPRAGPCARRCSLSGPVGFPLIVV